MILLAWSWDQSFDKLSLMSETKILASSEWWMCFFWVMNLYCWKRSIMLESGEHEFHNWMMWLENQDSHSITHLDSLEEITPYENHAPGEKMIFFLLHALNANFHVDGWAWVYSLWNGLFLSPLSENLSSSRSLDVRDLGCLLLMSIPCGGVKARR